MKPDILATILEQKRKEVAQLKTNCSTAFFEQTPNFHRKCHSLKKALRTSDFGIIAEMKRRSPSAGVIHENLVIADLAKQYESGGAAAISCLTDHSFFGGSINDLIELRSITNLPILRKDFIIDYIQVFEAKAAGADAILLIAEALPKKEINNLIQLAHDMDLEVLLEVHSIEEVVKTYGQADVIGVNNRNLKKQLTDLSQSEELYKFLPENKLKISESGIRSMEELDHLNSLGFNGALIGESILKHSEPKRFIQELQANV